ncbi:MAG: (2Fe-2S)-binding protein [Planctomycetes bacterium]|nr:(2Fe-2S)-binding protein [Planctomycetota bacterium]
MILCCCTGTTDRDLRSLVREGARDLDRLGEATGAGACCGGCRPALRELLREEGVLSSGGTSGGRLELRSEEGAAASSPAPLSCAAPCVRLASTP